jgi:uncharacterized protein YaiE (UPF0345 family)
MSTAFTTAEIDRSADFTVTADDAAVIEFSTGPGNGAQLNNGELELNLEDLNQNSNFTFGDVTDPAGSSVFSFQNQDGTDHTFNLGANGVSANTQFLVDTGNTSYEKFTGNGSTSGFTLLDGDTASVAIAVSDTGTANITGGSLYVNVTGDGNDP